MTEEQRQDEIREILGLFHYQAFIAGVCYGRDEWPTTAEDWINFERGIQSEAVGEHYEGWAPDTIEALTKVISE